MSERQSLARGTEDGFWDNYYNSKPAPGGVMINKDGSIEHGKEFLPNEDNTQQKQSPAPV